MAHHTHTSLPAGFRRRFPLELSPADYEALEAAGKAHGSKRAALLAGLAALQAAAAGEIEVAQAVAERDAARAEVAVLETKVRKVERARTEVTRESSGAAAKARDGADTLKAALAEMTRRTEIAEDDRKAEREARVAAEKKFIRLARTIVDELRCPRCGEFAPPCDWATEATEQGILVYHEPCGYHDGGLLNATSVLGRRLERGSG